MKYNNLTFDDLVTPTIEIAKRVNSPFVTPLGSTVITMIPCAPTESKPVGDGKPFAVGKEISQKLQIAIHKKGIMVVDICESYKNFDNFSKLKKGDFVFTRQGFEPLANKLVEDEETGQVYIMSIFDLNALTTIVVTPDYSTIGEEAVEIELNK